MHPHASTTQRSKLEHNDRVLNWVKLSCILLYTKNLILTLLTLMLHFRHFGQNNSDATATAECEVR